MARRAQLQLRLPTPVSWGGRRAGAGKEVAGLSPGEATRGAARAPISLPCPGDHPRQAEASLASVAAHLRNVLAGACPREPRQLSCDSLLGANRSHPPDRRSIVARSAHSWPARPRRAHSARLEPFLASIRKGLERSISFARSRDTARGAKWARLRLAELSQAPARRDGHRSAELRAVVRRVVVAAAGDKCAMPRCAAADLARSRRLATRGRPHRSARRAGGKRASDVDRKLKVAEQIEMNPRFISGTRRAAPCSCAPHRR